MAEGFPTRTLAATDLRQAFVDGMSKAAWTVTIVTTDGPAGRAGVTVSAMSSVSADTPQPTLLICINEKSSATAPLLANGVFCVNVLRDDQAALADTFAGRSGLAGKDRFTTAAWIADPLGSPRLVDPLVAFTCRTSFVEKVGTHHVVFGAIEAVHMAGAGAPLVYANRAYGQIGRRAD